MIYLGYKMEVCRVSGGGGGDPGGGGFGAPQELLVSLIVLKLGEFYLYHLSKFENFE